MTASITIEEATNNLLDLLDRANKTYYLPNHHKDPFDRILVAQSQVENLPLLTLDTKITQYGISIIW